MRFLALDMGDETHAAGVMLVGGVVQTLGFVQNHAGFGRMGFAGGGILHSALLGARSWTIPVFPCCLKCLERRVVSQFRCNNEKARFLQASLPVMSNCAYLIAAMIPITVIPTRTINGTTHCKVFTSPAKD